MPIKKYSMLDLFSGVGGASSAMIEDDKWEVTTVDNERKVFPKICENIFELAPRDFSFKKFDLIWASPPCTCFSMASMSNYWNKVEGVFLPKKEETVQYLRLVYHALWLINSLKYKWWFLENPKAILHKFIGKPSGFVTYCQYGDSRMKPTNLWGVHPPSFKYKHCKYNDSCHEPAPRGSSTGTQGVEMTSERAKVPYELSLAVKDSVENPNRRDWLKEAFG